MSSSMGDKKRALRGAFLAKREALSAVRVRAWGERIQRGVLALPAYRAACSIALYSPLGNEVATSGIMRDALAAGKRLFYPKVTAGSSGVFRVRSETDLVPGRYGILEPAGNQRLPDGGGDGLIVFVPGVAFDRAGNRLGRGMGWYDRWLAGLEARVPRIGLAYEFQLLEEVPAEPGDLSVCVIVTEERIVDCAGWGGGVAGPRTDGSCDGFNASGR